MQPIPVGVPFQRVAVDIMEMPVTLRGNWYVVVFMEYVTKWVEDQTTRLLMWYASMGCLTSCYLTKGQTCYQD